jgi:glycerol uptake facilitator-like aquaporin
MATNTFTGIRPVDVPVFLVAQLVGAVVAVVLFRWRAPQPMARRGSSPVRSGVDQLK